MGMSDFERTELKKHWNTMTSEDKDEFLEEIHEFLDSKGSVEMILYVGNNEGDVTFNQIDEHVDAARSTLNARRIQALELDVLEVDIKNTGDEEVKVYNFDIYGHALFGKMTYMRLPEKYIAYKEARSAYEQKKDELDNWITDSESVSETIEELTRRFGWEY